MPAEIRNLIHNQPGIFPPEDGSNFDLTLDIMIFNLARERMGKKLTPETLASLGRELTEYFASAAPDLKSALDENQPDGPNLAQDHVGKLLNHAVVGGCRTEGDLLKCGAVEFYNIGRYVLGPLWAAYVHEALSAAQDGDVFLFAARDATPMYWTACGLEASKNGTQMTFVHVDWNRWFMAQEDELDESGIPLTIASNSQLRLFYEQMGFLNGHIVKIIEPGAWGSAANALKTMLPKQAFELRFMFSHMPERIYGFLNNHCPNVDPNYFEIINDTAEALPKPYVRPTTLTTENGRVVADLTGKVIDSSYMQIWSWAVNKGALDAAQEFDADNFKIQAHVQNVIQFSKLSASGMWTGVLPKHTLTWTEGEKWRAGWKHGKIPPLR